MSAKIQPKPLGRTGDVGVAQGTESWLSGSGYRLSSGPARVHIDTGRCRSRLDRRLFGGFLEHLGRAVYQGVYEPGSPLADERGYRRDVLECIRGMEVPIIRYPGGNFVSGYDWLDGVGPLEQRPSVLDRAWNSTETNQFGTNEFIEWCQRVDTEPMLVFNLGTNTPEMAAAYVEYCNRAGGSRWSELRRAHGYESPHDVRYWCLGNELDGPWQQGHMLADEYGKVALETARRVRAVDPAVQLIACGSSNTELPSYGEWDRSVLKHCYEDVDAIALHNYYGNTAELSGSSTPRYIAMNLDMECQIQEIATISDTVGEQLRSKKRLWLAFDEWNIWYRARSPEDMDGERKVAPRLLEETYNLEDALLVGGIINTLLRQSARVRIACLAQVVNVIAPLVTNESGLLKQSIFYPYEWALRHARGRVLDIEVESEAYPVRGEGLRPDFARNDFVPFLDVAVTWDEIERTASVFVLNRDLDEERELVLDWANSTPSKVLVTETITGPDLKAGNSFEQPHLVAPQIMDAPAPGRMMTFKAPPASYSVIKLDLS